MRGLNRGTQSRLLNRFDLGSNGIVFGRLDGSIRLVSATPLPFDEDCIDAETCLVRTSGVHNYRTVSVPTPLLPLK